MYHYKPMFAATTLPTMPHRNTIEACRIMLNNFPEIPAVPKLSMSARMYMDGVPCLLSNPEKRELFFDLSQQAEIEEFYGKYLSEDIEHFAITPKSCPGLYTLFEMLERSSPPQLKLIHIMLFGPLTWGLILKDKNGEPAWYDPTMRDVLVKTMVMKARWFEKKVKQTFPAIGAMVTIGEPSLGMVSSPFGGISSNEVINAINEILQSIEGMSCVHCCANIDWPLLMNTDTKCINFDAYHFSEKIALYPMEIDNFLRRGGILAWGIVPVILEDLLSEDNEGLITKMERGVDLLKDKGIDKYLILEQSIITPSCEVASLSLEVAERALRMTRTISETMRKRHSLC